MKKYFIPIFLISIFFVFCSKKEDEDIIPQNEMINILIDIHLADAYLTRNVLKDISLNQPESLSYYNQIFTKYQITRKDFYKSFKFYMRNTEKLKDIYKIVIDSLEKKLNYYDSLTKLIAMKKNLWALKKEWEIPKDSDLISLFFALPTDEQGVYTLYADIFLYNDDLSKNLRLSLKAIYEDGTTSVKYEPISWKKNYWKEYYINLPTDTTKKLKMIVCKVLDHDPMTSYMHLKVKDITLTLTEYKEHSQPSRTGWSTLQQYSPN